MIADHNIKVNGRWVRAGESYGEPKKEVLAPVKVQEEKPEKPAVKEPEKVPEKKPEKVESPKSPTRRKSSK